MPHAPDSCLARPLELLVAAASRVPILTLALGGSLVLLAVAGAYRHLGFHTGRADLLSPDSEYHQRWLRYTEEFGAEEDVYVVVEGNSPEVVPPALDAVAERLTARPELFRHVLARVDTETLRHKGLYYLDQQELQTIAAQVDRHRPLSGGDWSFADLSLPVSTAARSFEGSRQEQAVQLDLRQLSGIRQALELLASALADGGVQEVLPERPNWQAEIEADQRDLPERFLSRDGKIGLVLLQLTPDDEQSFVRYARHIAALREINEQVEAEYEDVAIGVTGLPILEYDEMQSANTAQTAALVALFGVGAVFCAGFAGWRFPTLIAISLLTAVVWTLGYTTLAVGHLNILTSAFGAMLIGLGDYGVHFVAHYLDLRRRTRSTDEALRETARTVGPGIAVGAFTTAGAFLAASLTDFLGVAELGIIAGGGVLLCWLADMTILPAMIKLLENRRRQASANTLLDLGSWLAPLTATPRLTVVVGAAAAALLAVGIPLLRYDYNLLDLQPEGLESVALHDTLIERMESSAYFALSIADSPQEARARKQQLETLDTVQRVETLVDALPPDADRKQPLVAWLAHTLRELPAAPPRLPVASQERLAHDLAALQRGLATLATAEPALGALADQAENVRQQVLELPPQEYQSRMQQAQQALVTTVWQPLDALRRRADPQPPRLEDLPDALVHRFVGRNGKHLLRVYCAGNFWDKAVMERFVQQVRSVDPEATGNPMQIYEASHQMNRSYLEAAGYALVAIVVFLWLDLRAWRDVILTTLPLLLGMVALFGLLGHLEIELNPANMIVLPLILGIGIDNGVHIVHDYRRQGAGYQGPLQSTLTAVMVNSLTTMVGFGALMLASHQGLQSLGRVLTLGIATCLTAALLLPALLLWHRQRRNARSQRLLQKDDELLADLPVPRSDREPPTERIAA